MTIIPLLSPTARRQYQVEQLRQRAARRQEETLAEADWRDWLHALFPDTFSAPFADRHILLWDWINGIHAEVKPSPAAFIDAQPRGGGKTTTAETAIIRLGAMRARNFVLYVRGSQDKANESIQSIAGKLESTAVARHYPDLANRKVSRYGHSRGWRVDMLRCASNFNIIGLGLDAAVRGVKLDDYRPDIIVLDDIDDKQDTPKTKKRKLDVITLSILPAGATHCAYLVEQNLIYDGSIVSDLVTGEAGFLHDRLVSGPHVAVEDLTYEEKPEGGYTITGGVATWEGQSLEICEQQINDWGLTPFLRESQQEVEESGGIWDHVEFHIVDYADLPDMVRGAVWIDPAVTATDDSDCQGIAAGGLGDDSVIYVTYSWEGIDSPLNIVKRGILKAIELGYEYVGVETDQGGDTWISVYDQAWQAILDSDEYPHIIGRDEVARRVKAAADSGNPDTDLETLLRDHPYHPAFIWYDDEWQPLKRPTFRSAKAGAGHGSKVHRNQQMLSDHERGRVAYLRGTHNTAVRALRRFPKKPLDYADGQYWLWYDLNRARRQSRIG